MHTIRSASANNMYELGSSHLINNGQQEGLSSIDRQQDQQHLHRLYNQSSKGYPFNGSNSAINGNDPLKDYHAAQQAAAAGKYKVKNIEGVIVYKIIIILLKF